MSAVLMEDLAPSSKAPARWYRLFFVFGQAAGLVAASCALIWWQRRIRAGKPRGHKRGSGAKNPLTELTGRADHRLAGAAVAAAVETGRALLTRPSIRTSLEAALLKVLRGTGEGRQVIESVRENALRIALLLQQRGSLPLRIGVDGLPGSGKSALARALADRLGMKWKSLDHENMNVPRDFRQERTIYEHHRLFRTQDVDVFDAIVYVDESVEVCKSRILQRAREEARESLIIDVLDYEKLRKIGKLAFRVCQGEPISIPGSRLFMKVRPPQGFRATENLVSRLHASGHDAQALQKEEMLFLLLYGKRRSGLLTYFLPGAYTKELSRGLLAGMREYFAE